MARRKGKKTLPTGLGNRDDILALKDAINATSIQQVEAINELSTLVEDQLSRRMLELIKLFTPVSNAAKEQLENKLTAAPAAAAAMGGDTLVKETPGVLQGASGAVGGTLAGIGGMAAGAGAGALGAGSTALGGGLKVLSAGLKTMGNPAVAIGATVFTGFLAGLAGVAWLSGKALQELGQGFTDLGVGLDNLSQSSYPDSEQLNGLTTAMSGLLGAFDTGDAIKMAIADGTMFSDLAKGLSDLSSVDLDSSAIDTAGDAFKGFIEKIGIGDAITTRIITGSAFQDIATGLQSLNDIQIDSVNLENAGKSLQGFLENVTSISAAAGGQIIDMFGAQTLPAIATGLEALDRADIDPSKVANAGLGLQAFLDSVSLGQVVGGVLSQAIDKQSLIDIADGIKYVNDIGPTISADNVKNIAASVDVILEPVTNLVGIAGLQGIDDNLIPFANGIGEIGKVSTQIDLQSIDNLSNAVKAVINAGNNLIGIAGLQGLDDNLIPFANGMNAIQQVASTINVDDFENVKLAMSKLMAGITGQEEGDTLGQSFIKGVTGAISSFSFPDVSNLQGIGDIFNGLSNASTLDPKVVSTNFAAFKEAIITLDDSNLNTFDKFNNFVDIVTRLESLDPARLNDLSDSIRNLGVDITAGIKPTAARLEEQRQRAGTSNGSGPINTNVNSSRISNQFNSTNNTTNVTYAPPIQPKALMFT